jgi:1-acyl-sn-glycerol-3-phosphate acyltransferase
VTKPRRDCAHQVLTTALCWGPEGTRSKTGGLIEGREGIAFVATRANVPILPAALWGVEKILKRPRPRVNIRVGRPFRLPEGRAKGEQLHDYTDRVMCAIAALLPEQYHGVYAGHPLIEEMARIVR